MPSRRPRLFPLGALLLVAAVPAAAHAQFATIEARAGVVPAVGRYADALGTGQTLGVGASLRFTPTLAVRLDAEANSGFDGGAASPDLYTYLIGLETQLAPARGLRAAPLQLTASLSGGATQLRYGSAAGAADVFRPSVGAGLRLTAELTRTFGLFGGASAVATLLDDASPVGGALGGQTLVTVPIVAGLRVRF